MSAADADLLAARAAASPLMVLPLAKPGNGYLTLLVQWQQGGAASAAVTTLQEYRAGAPQPHLRLALYRELAASHGLGLLRGSLHSPRLISAPEVGGPGAHAASACTHSSVLQMVRFCLCVVQGRTVSELLRALYTDDDGYALVHAFNHAPSQFDFDKLLSTLRLA